MTAVMATTTTAATSPISRSQLEMMLDSLMKREEKPKDVPPALPARPPSRGRLPSVRKSLPPIRFNDGDSDLPWEENDKNGNTEEVRLEVVPKLNEDLPKKEDTKVIEENLELERRADNAESEVKLMKEEFCTLEKQILEYKEMCAKYETQIKSLENELSKKEKENASLQVRKNENQQQNQQQNNHNSPNDAKQTPVGTLIREFENQKKNFEEGAKALAQTGQNNPLEDLKKLKAQFFSWRKEYKARLHETKVALEKALHKGKKKKSWWIKCSKH